MNAQNAMAKFTTEQLKAAMLEFSKLNDSDSNAAYAMTFDELHRRLGDDALDAWLDSHGL